MQRPISKSPGSAIRGAIPHGELPPSTHADDDHIHDQNQNQNQNQNQLNQTEYLVCHNNEKDSPSSRSNSNNSPLICPPFELNCACGARVGSEVRRWTSTLNAGARSCGQRHGAELLPVIVLVFRLRRFAWLSKYVTFYRVHAAYFLTLGSLGTLLMYAIPLSNSKRLDFVDAVFTAFSAACGTGLQTVRSPDLTQLHYLVILVLLNLGAPVLISLLPLYARRFYFHLCVRQCSNQQDSYNGQQQQQPQTPLHDQPQLQRTSLHPSFCIEREVPPCSSNCNNDIMINGLLSASASTSSSTRAADPKVGFDHHDDDSESELALPRAQDVKQIDQEDQQQPPGAVPVLDISPRVNHQQPNDSATDAAVITIQSPKKEVQHPSNGVDDDCCSEKWKVSVDSKQALRTLEYRALVALSWTVICYFVGSQIIGFVLGSLYFLASPHDAAVVRRKDINPTFYALFTSVSTFTNAGYNVNNDSMLSFQKSTVLLLLYTVLASIGNTMYAPVLRLLVWIRYSVVDEKDPDKMVYDYLLRHPRRCFTNLFPRSQTIWLVVIFFTFTMFPLLLFCKLEWNEALKSMTAVEKLAAGLYQIVGTRNGGGTVVDLYHLTPALLFIFMVLMYISAYPIFLSLQTSSDEYDDAELTVPQNYFAKVNLDHWESILAMQSRRLLARDSSYLFFAILFLCLSENRSIKKDPLNYSIFNIVFEVISAYGSVGLSLGYHCNLQLDKTIPCEDVPYSFSGTWTWMGKLILVFVMFCGRHRGLPDDIDPAIRLPTKLLAPTTPETPQKSGLISPSSFSAERRCEEFVTELARRMQPQLQLAQRVPEDTPTRVCTGKVQDV